MHHIVLEALPETGLQGLLDRQRFRLLLFAKKTNKY